MVGDTVGVVGADVGDPELVYQELRELEDSGGELLDLMEELPIVRQLRGHRVEFADHADAGARGRDDGLVVLEDPYETPDQRYRLALVASVKVHLAAAGLIQWEVHLYTEAFKDLDGRLPRLREERVVKARDKERDAHVGCLLLPYETLGNGVVCPSPHDSLYRRGGFYVPAARGKKMPTFEGATRAGEAKKMPRDHPLDSLLLTPEVGRVCRTHK